MEGMVLMSCPRITCSRQHEKAGSTCACRVAYRAVSFMPGRIEGFGRATVGYGRMGAMLSWNRVVYRFGTVCGLFRNWPCLGAKVRKMRNTSDFYRHSIS